MRNLFLIGCVLTLSACSHPKAGEIITVRGQYNGKMFGYFTPSEYPEEKWSLAGDSPDQKFTRIYASLFSSKKDSLMALHKPQFDYQLEVYGMIVEVTVKGKLEGGKNSNFCKHEICNWQLVVEDAWNMKPLGKK